MNLGITLYCIHLSKNMKNISMLVYKFICPSCHLLYIGSTIKILEHRVFEHFGSSFRTRRSLTCPVQSEDWWSFIDGDPLEGRRLLCGCAS